MFAARNGHDTLKINGGVTFERKPKRVARLHLRADKQGARAWLEPCAYVEELREAEGIAYT